MTARPPTVVVAGTAYPATLSTAEAAQWFNCSPERLQTERGSGRLPVEPLQLGHRLRWPTALVAQAVGLDAEIVAGGCLIVADGATDAVTRAFAAAAGARPDAQGGEDAA